MMDFPATPTEPCKCPSALDRSLGVEIVACEKGRFDYLVEVESESVLRSIVPGFRTLTAVPARGVTVTAQGEDQYDAVSRFFAPASGSTKTRSRARRTAR